MAITTIDQLIAGFHPAQDVFKAAFTAEAIGVAHSSWYLAGMPGAASVPAMGVNGTALARPIAGQIDFPAAVAGQNIYLARFEGVHAGSVGGATICDRIWMNSGLVLATTTAQAITQPTLDRDNQFDGSWTGFGVQVAIEQHTASGNGAAHATTTLQYTNSDGVAGRTGTMPSWPASAQVGTFVPFLLQAGDKGVRSIQSVTLGTTYGTTGAISLVMYRQVASIGMPLANIQVDRDAVALGLPRMHDNSVPFLLFSVQGSVSAGVSDFGITWAQG